MWSFTIDNIGRHNNRDVSETWLHRISVDLTLKIKHVEKDQNCWIDARNSPISSIENVSYLHSRLFFYIYHIPPLIRFLNITYSQLPDSIFRMRDTDTMILGDGIILNCQYCLCIDAKPCNLRKRKRNRKFEIEILPLKLKRIHFTNSEFCLFDFYFSLSFGICDSFSHNSM